jgi:hypothetical protein
MGLIYSLDSRKFSFQVSPFGKGGNKDNCDTVQCDTFLCNVTLYLLLNGNVHIPFISLTSWLISEMRSFKSIGMFLVNN